MYRDTPRAVARAVGNRPAWSCCVWLAVAFMAMPGSGHGAQQPGRQITGAVRDSASGEALEFVEVAIPELARYVLTDSAGRYVLAGLPARRLTVTFQMIGYASAERVVDLTADNATQFVALALRVVEMRGVDVEVSRLDAGLGEARATSTLTAEEVARERGQTLGETIEEVPGVSVIQYGPSIAKPVVRGLHSHRIIVTNRGVRQEGQQWGGEHAPEIDAFAAHEIQVIRGAGAVLYGSDALGGVVRVEPRPLPAGPGVGGEAHINLFSNNRQAAGSLLLEAGRLAIPALGPTAFRLQVSRRRAGDAETPNYNLRNTGFSEFNLSADAGIRRRWGTSELSVSRFDTNLGLFTGAHVGNFDDLQRAMERPPRQTDFSYDIIQPNQRVTHDAVVWRNDLFVVDGALLELDYAFQFNRRREFDSHGPLSTRDTPAFGLDLYTHTLDARLHHSLLSLEGTLGLSGMRQGNINRGKAFLIPQYRLYTGGAYLLERLPLGRLRLGAGLRYDYRWQRVYPFNDAGIVSPDETRTYDGLAGSLETSYLLAPSWSIAASLGRAWRAPNVNERYSQGVHHGTAQYELGDTSLTTEATWSADVTLRHQSERASLQVSAFRNTIDGYIYLHPREPVLTLRGAFPAFTYRQADALLYGLEASVEIAATSALDLEATTSVIRGIDRATDDPLYDMPADRVTLWARYRLPGPSWAADPYFGVGTLLVREQDRVPPVTVYALPTAGYALLNFEAGVGRLAVGGLTIDASLQVRNLLNRRYRDYLSRYKLFADDPGRDVVLRIGIPFGATGGDGPP